ncbi:MAG: PilZ domain-containing protein [Planctomycetes bacterium]|nr:PilZ domain-containing protein [Planctomycetota bacterium]
MAENNNLNGEENSQEKRCSERINYDFPVYFYFLSGKRKPREVSYYKGYTQNVSASGINLLIESPSIDVRKMFDEKENNIGLEIYLPAVFRSKPISCKGKIVWKKEIIKEEVIIVVGIELQNIDAIAREAMQKAASTLRNITDSIIEEEEL